MKMQPKKICANHISDIQGTHTTQYQKNTNNTLENGQRT